MKCGSIVALAIWALLPLLNWLSQAAPASEPRASAAASRDHETVWEPNEKLPDRYGKQLPVVGPPSLPQGAMDVAWKDGWLYVLSHGRLCTFPPTAKPGSAPAGELAGMGNTRQIEIAGNLAAITSREDGLWLVDVTTPAKPVLLSHYDTIELATGIALGENIALVACRQYGIEQIDVSNPRRPRHMSTFRTGEAQSVYLQNGLAYIGDWAPREVVVCDVRNPWRPQPVSHIPMDGFGDGVFVRGNICFAATGHHSRAMRSRQAGDPAYGAGHGLEIFDVSDPKNAKLLSRTKLPRLYHLSWDMWGVQISGDFAVVADTHNGVFVFNIKDLTRPVPVGHHRLPLAAKGGLPDAVGGFAIGEDCIYLAGVQTGLHTVRVPGIRPVPKRPPERIAFSETAPPPRLTAPAVVAYRPEGQVHAVAVDQAGGEVWVAAGSAGLHRFKPGDAKSGRQAAESKGVMFGVDVRDDLVACGEGVAGFSLWRRSAGGVELLSRYQSRFGGIGQVCLSPDKHYAILHAGANVLVILDISSPGEPKSVLDDRHIGLFYRTPFSHGFLPGGRFGCLWHVTGIFFFDLDGSRPRFSGWSVPGRMDFSGGVAVCGDRFLVLDQGGYAILEPGQTEIVKNRDLVRLKDFPFRGKPSVFENTLYLSQRWQGKIAAIDITKTRQPRMRWSLEIEGNPGVVQELGGQAIIPGGYDGVIVRPK